MINISLETHPDLYKDYRKGLDFLSEINCDDFQYPSNITYFHVYSEVQTGKELECIKSFLATQNLEKTKLVLWSDYDIRDNKLIAPYKDLIDLRIYDPIKESKNTLLENHPIWIHSDISDSKHYMKSGLLRFLVTNKYGGIWADMDMVFLKDFKPILDQEWAYMWGSEKDFANFGPCAAMMNFKKRSALSQTCLNEIALTTPQKDSTILDHMLLAKVYKKSPFTVFPSTFFNTEWLINQTDRQFRSLIGHGFNKIKTDKDFLFLDAFAWHWHNSSNNNRLIEAGCKFDLLRNRTNKLLKEKGFMI
jgi:hypothetical protein